MESLLLLDRGVTNTLCVCAQPQTQLTRWLKRACVCLELSGHGLLWFGLCGVLLLLHYLTSDYVYLTHTTNMFTLLITDIIIVAPIKVFFKRPRPPVNKGTIPLSVSSVDHYAFPSGHASRCVALAVYFCYMPPFRLQTHLWYIWALVVSVSRVMIGRHHVADVVAGMAAGLFIFETVRQFGLIWELQN